MGAASLFSRLVGLLRDRILAGEFGASETLDIYYASFRIPDFLFQLLIIGALSAGFIPLFARLRHRDEKEAWQFASTVFNAMITCLAIIAVILAIIAPWIVALIAPGFSVAAQRMTITLTRIMLFSPIFLGMSALFGGILQAYKKFFINAIAPIFYNVGIIIGALYLVPLLGLSGLAWGVVLGAVLHAGIQFPGTYGLGLRARVAHPFRDSHLATLARLMIPRTFALGVTQATLVAMTMIASTLTQGSLTIFNFASNIASFPIGIFGITYAIAAFPTLTEHVVRGNADGFRRSFAATIRHILFFIVPSTVLFFMLRAQIVRAVLGAGAFDWNDTVHTMNTLAAFSFGMFALAMNYVLIRAFWAYEDTWTPALTATLGSVIAIVVGFMTRRMFGVEALGAAFALGDIIQLIMMWILLRRHTQNLAEASIAVALAKIFCGTAFLALGVQGTKMLFGSHFGTDTFFNVVLQGGSAAAVGILMYCVVCWFLRSKELLHFVASIHRRIAPNPEQLELFEQDL
ncbi:MAG: murein biosynthesis integral membrane protein MurJ [Candidatus Yonathbacteria bacterium]|nr:murein biosynthesis integral membrane protein MurJ [Candidatus Yonathbacteria bacterium]